MMLKDALLPDYDHETGTTRRLLERVPSEKLSWKPHDRSMSLARLSTHLGEVLGYAHPILRDSSLDLEAIERASQTPREETSSLEILKLFDANCRKTRELISGVTDAELITPWTLKRGAYEIYTLPKVAVLRSMVFNHLIHHRGQLSVYLRLNEVKLPPMYGPTADETS